MIKPRRSVLFMPGANPRVLEKAKNIDADTLVFDLEDAVAPAAKAEARTLTTQALASGAYGYRELVVRINGVDTAWWQDDIEAVAKTRPAAVLVPKVETREAVVQVMAVMEQHAGLSATELWVMLETPRGFLNAETVASSHKRLTALVVGTNDLTKELRARRMPDRQSVMTALGMAVLVGRAHGQAVLDGVYNDFKDARGFERECLQGRDMGFDGKSLIHPSQIEVANRIFAPSDTDLEHARALKDAFAAATATQKGVATFQGKMIEALHVEEAERIIAMSEMLAMRR